MSATAVEQPKKETKAKAPKVHIGRMVWHWPWNPNKKYEAVPQPAIVMRQHDNGKLSLSIVEPGFMNHLDNVEYTESKETGCWSFPDK